MMMVTRFSLLLLAAAAAPARHARAADDLAGPHECVFFGDPYPCTLTALPSGFMVEQKGAERFDGVLAAKGSAFHLEGKYKTPGGGEQTLSGDLERYGDQLKGEGKLGTTPTNLIIRGAKVTKAAAAAPALAAVLARLTTREAVAAGAQLPLTVRFYDAPKLSFTVKEIDEKTWDKQLSGIFGMVPAENHAALECTDKKLECKLIAQSGADVWFYFAKTPQGIKLKKIELPVHGD